MCEPYNGYPNRETWAVALWQDNDQGFHERVREMADNARREAEHGTRKAERILADALKSMWEEFEDPEIYGDPAAWAASIYPMLKDVGSFYRVDWDHIAESVLSD